jgi:hypothetical protein
LGWGLRGIGKEMASLRIITIEYMKDMRNANNLSKFE